jgi:hypothetical protein
MELALSLSVKYYTENVLEEGAEFIIWTKHKTEEMSVYRNYIYYDKFHVAPYEIYHYIYSCDRLTFPVFYI